MGNTPPYPATIRFANFTVDLASGDLRQAGAKVKLQEQPFQMLAVLLERPGELVTREELRRRLWPGNTFVDFEHGLATALKKLRRALGDSPVHSRFIETLPRRGYRFIARVEAGLPAAKTILAVLPFDNLTGDAALDYLADGITEELIARLGRFDPQRLGVIARASALRYKNSSKDVDQIGAELGAGYAVKGSLSPAGDRLRVTAELIKVADRTHLWAGRFEGERATLPDIQADVARLIARFLHIDRPLARRAAGAGTSTAIPAAHSAFLLGRYSLNKGSAEGVRDAIERFAEAVRLDANYAVAQAGMAVALDLADHFRVAPGDKAFPQAKSAARRALEINELLPEAHNALALALHSYDWDWAGAEQAYQRAIELNPNFATARHWHGFYLGILGRIDEALAEMRRALDLNPLSLIIQTHLGLMLYRGRRYDEAIAQLQRTLLMEPGFAAAHCFLGWAYEQKGMYEQAIAHLRKALAASPGSPDKIGALGHAQALWGKKDAARQALKQLHQLSARRFVSAYDFAIVHTGLGEHEQAVVWLENACAQRSFSLLLSLKAEARLDPLRSHPGFRAILGRIGLPP